MLYLSILLHIYQPPTQFPQVTKGITDSSYRLILKILQKTKGKITLNITASLTEQLAKLGQEDVLAEISDLAKKKQIEFTGSAAYHPLLPRLPQDLMRRQIELNTQINQKYFGKIYCPSGFFPPELAYSNQLGELLEELGCNYVVVDEHAYPGRIKKIKHDELYVKRDTNSDNDNNNEMLKQVQHDKKGCHPEFISGSKKLNIFFRSSDLSLSIAFSQIKTIAQFRHLISSVIARRDPSLSLRAKRSNLNDSSGQAPQSQTTRDRHGPLHGPRDDSDIDSYIIIALDGETFGHHQPGQDKLLFDILSYKSIKIVTINELKKYFHKERLIRPTTSCWGVSDEDMRKKIYWPRWSYPGNPIHKLQWELTRLVIKSRRHSGESGEAGRLQNRFWTSQNDEPTIFDKSLHSDQYWWASHKPYWHPEMIRRGAEMLVKTLKENPEISDKIKKRGERLYYDIVETAHRTYGEKVITF